VDGPPAGRTVCGPATGWTLTLLVSRVMPALWDPVPMTLGVKTARQFLRRGVDVIAAVVTAKHIAISGITMLPPPEPDAWFTNVVSGKLPIPNQRRQGALDEAVPISFASQTAV
jgi:hypothetical protein